MLVLFNNDYSSIITVVNLIRFVDRFEFKKRKNIPIIILDHKVLFSSILHGISIIAIKLYNKLMF